MKRIMSVVQAEKLKMKHMRFTWISYLAFGLAPVMGAIFMIVLRNGTSGPLPSGLAMKAEAMHISFNWTSYLDILTQAVGVGGILVFGFVASWVFGREYVEGTAKDMLSLPASRSMILNAKFLIYVRWCLTLAVSNLLVSVVLGSLLGLPTGEMERLGSMLISYASTTILTILAVLPVAFFAIWSRGYLGPLGVMALMLVLAQILSALGLGLYFPWAIPGIFSGAGGELRKYLGLFHYSLLFATAVMGYIATIWYWNKVDQNK